MKTLYCSVHTSSEDFVSIFNRYPGKLENVAQKFHSLLSEGLYENLQRKIPVLSCPPIGVNKFYTKTEQAIFYYVPIIPIPLLKNVVIWIYISLFVLLWNFGNLFSKRIVYISATTLFKFLPVFVISKLLGAKLILITCDIPKMTFTQRITNLNMSLRYKLKSFLINSVWIFSHYFDYYVFLTQKMNDEVNKRGRPYVIVEGFSDIKLEKISNNINNKYEKNIIVYAGGLFEKYGVKMLIDAVEDLNDNNVELWLMGKGEMENDLESNKYSHVKYLGTKLNAEVLEIEKKATLLVNPRFSNEEYTAYSFPSKVMEYMSTGTLALITKLEGIPSEYYDYCEIIEDESVVGVKMSLLKVLSMNPMVRHAKGLRAKSFVLRHKNNKAQCEKILNMIRG